MYVPNIEVFLYSSVKVQSIKLGGLIKRFLYQTWWTWASCLLITFSHYLFHKSLNQKLVFNLDIFYNIVLITRFPVADRIIIYQITQANAYLSESIIWRRGTDRHRSSKWCWVRTPHSSSRNQQGVFTSTQKYTSYKIHLMV